MRILVISDTHGNCDRVYEVYKKLVSEAPVDIIVHCGDYASDAMEIQARLGIHVAWVKGNCDGSASSDDFEIIETEYGKLLLTHGHMEQVDYKLTSLMYKALENDCKAVLFGHTHRALIDEAGGIKFVNPGSLTNPRDGSDGSYAIVTTSEDRLDAAVVYYSTIMGKPKKPQGGYIRGLLNYSDRF